jgi:hypothetical protein
VLAAGVDEVVVVDPGVLECGQVRRDAEEQVVRSWNEREPQG